MLTRQQTSLEGTPRSEASTLTEGIVVCLLAALPAFPLVALRAQNPFSNGSITSLLVLAWGGLALSWDLATRSTRTGIFSDLLPSLAPLLRRSLFLLPFTVLAFGLPLREQFWAGCNEGFLIAHAHQPLWSEFLDRFSNRPLAELGAHIGSALSPSSLDGYLWLAVALRFGTGLLTGDVLGECLSGVAIRNAVSCAAALLYVVNPSESSRFLVIGMVVYHIPVFAFVLGLWLYVKSYVLGLRSLLALSSVALCVSALCYESVLPIAFFAPGLLLLVGSRPKRWVWLAHWWGTWIVLATRFVIFLMSTPIGYQRYLVRPASLRGIPESLGLLAQPTFAYLKDSPSFLLNGVGLGSFVIATIAIWWERDERGSSDGRRRLVRGVLISGGAVLLGLAPYVVFPMRLLDQVIHRFATFRTQYYAAPGQAALYAVLFALMALPLPRVVQRPFLGAVTGFLVALAAGGAFAAQRRPLRDEPGGVFLGDRLETVARIFREVDRVAPDLDRKMAVFFVLGHGMRTPFGPDYDLLALSCARLGVPAYAGSYSQGHGWVPRRNFGSPEKEEILGFDGPVKAFKLRSDGSIVPFTPREEVAMPTQEIDPSVACETWTLPPVLFGVTATGLGAAPFDRGHQDFLQVAWPLKAAKEPGATAR